MGSIPKGESVLGRRRLVAVISVVAAAVWAVPVPALAATTFTVTKTADTADGVCNSDCSLREAITAANASFDASTINLPAGHYKLTRTGVDEDFNATGDLDIRSPITLLGAGARKTIIDGNGTDRVLHVPPIDAPSDFAIVVQGVTITNGKVTNEIGGGIWHQEDQATFYLYKSTVSNNRALQGGGIQNGYQDQTNMVIETSTISGNHAGPDGQGGGIQNYGSLTLRNSTVTGNKATFAGGIEMFDGTLAIEWSTIAFNTATQPGGGLIINSGTVTALGSIIAKNKAGQFVSAKNCSAAITSNGHNLENGTSCGFTGPGDVNGDPSLDSLGNYGGPTNTLRLHAGSPAINAGGNVFPATDQRGVKRPRGSAADIGAYER
jgi:CSLREA domain-containing protein